MGYQSDPLFNELILLVLESEGKYSNDLQDPGGPTNFGISWQFNKDILSQMGITEQTMQFLTQDQAKQIYYNRYWLAGKCNTIQDKALAYLHFDTIVNEGMSIGNIFLISTMVLTQPKRLIHYIKLRLHAYAQDKNQKRYLQGWDNRLVNVMSQIEQWI